MGMSAGGDGKTVKSEINVTPLVDVVLVLLIIFLVTMPVVMRTVTLEVPRKAEVNEDTSTAAKSIIVTQRADGSVVLADGVKDDQTITALELPKMLRDLLKDRQGEKVVFVDFCEHVMWQDVVATMDRVRSVAEDKSHNEIKVALRKVDKPTDRDPNKTEPCPERQRGAGGN